MLVDALTGKSGADRKKSITTLDGRVLKVDIPYPSPGAGGSPIKPGQIVKVAGEGMPISKKGATKKKGDLIVKLDVIFPPRLSAAQSEGIRKILS